MAIEGKVRTLYTDKTQQEAIFPTTKVSAVTDNEGNGLNTLLEHIAYVDPMDMESAAVLANADTLGGYPASDYAFVEDLKNLKPEDIGAAPAGYGLGGVAQPVNSADEAIQSGFYQAPIFSELNISGQMVGYVTKTSDQWITQIWHFSGLTVKRDMQNGVWQLIEWFNPLLDLGIEYLTTERYKGLPVYIKACELDLSPAGSKHAGFASGITNVVSIDGSIFNRDDNLVYHLALYKEAMCMNEYGNLVFNITENSLARIIMKYTK